jgi:hypothetical protein
LEIDNTIKKLQEDWILNQKIINKLQYKKSSSSEDIDKEFSIEFIQKDQKPMKKRRRIKSEKIRIQNERRVLKRQELGTSIE